MVPAPLVAAPNPPDPAFVPPNDAPLDDGEFAPPVGDAVSEPQPHITEIITKARKHSGHSLVVVTVLLWRLIEKGEAKALHFLATVAIARISSHRAIPKAVPVRTAPSGR